MFSKFYERYFSSQNYEMDRTYDRSQSNEDDIENRSQLSTFQSGNGDGEGVVIEQELVGLISPSFH